MAEKDPREYRGGAHEPPDAKGGPDSWADNEGVVPREMVDDPPAPPDERRGDPQALSDDVQGAVTGAGQTEETVDRNAGDEADATTWSNTSADPEDIEEGRPVSRVDQANVAHQTDKGPRTG